MKRRAAEVSPLLPYDAVFRIEVSLSSQTTSAVVMRTTARLYSLEGVQSSRPHVGDAEWKSLAYGAPCIQLIRQGSVFTIRVVIAEVESGISLWEGAVDGNSRYGAMQRNFHTFTCADTTHAIQFVNEQEAGRMLESMQDLLTQQQQHLARLTGQPQLDSQPVVFRKPSKPPRRLSKKDISSPCNFKHVSGITMQRTLSCEQELRGTIQRKMRSLSLSNLSRSKSGDEGTEDKGRRSLKRVKTVGRKVSKESPDCGADMKRADPQRMSLPSHFRQRERQPITSSSFIPPSSHLKRALSQSSGDISHGQPSHSSSSLELRPPQAAIERRHTMSHRPINYQALPTQPHTPNRSEATTPVSEPGGQVQHIAIASSDIVGWTADGRLIVQMPAGRPEVGVASGMRPASTRRASTGQFNQDQAFPQLTRQGSSETVSLKPPLKTLQHSVSDRTIRNRPLPPTPLDIAMPHSAITSRPIPNNVAMPTTLQNGLPGSKPAEKQTPPQAAGIPQRFRPEPSLPSHARSDSVEASLQEVTEQMSQALAQFDDLLGVAQTSL